MIKRTDKKLDTHTDIYRQRDMQAYKNFLLPCSAYNIRPIICFELLLSLMESTNYRCRHIYAQFLLHAYGGKCPGNCPKGEMSWKCPIDPLHGYCYLRLHRPILVERLKALRTFACLMYSTGCPSSSGSYSVLVPLSGGVSWVLLRPTSEIFAVPPRAPEVEVHSAHWNKG